MAPVRMMTVWPSVLARLNPLQIQNIGRGLGVTGRGWRHPCSFGDSTSSCQGAGCILHSCEINIQHTDYLQQDPFTLVKHERNSDTNEGEIMHQVLDFFIVEGRIVTLTQCVCYILNFLNADMLYIFCARSFNFVMLNKRFSYNKYQYLVYFFERRCLFLFFYVLICRCSSRKTYYLQ